MIIFFLLFFTGINPCLSMDYPKRSDSEESFCLLQESDNESNNPEEDDWYIIDESSDQCEQSRIERDSNGTASPLPENGLLLLTEDETKKLTKIGDYLAIEEMGLKDFINLMQNGFVWPNEQQARLNRFFVKLVGLYSQQQVCYSQTTEVIDGIFVKIQAILTKNLIISFLNSQSSKALNQALEYLNTKGKDKNNSLDSKITHTLIIFFQTIATSCGLKEENFAQKPNGNKKKNDPLRKARILLKILRFSNKKIPKEFVEKLANASIVFTLSAYLQNPILFKDKDFMKRMVNYLEQANYYLAN